MSDSNFIARLYAVNGHPLGEAAKAITSPKNASRYLGPNLPIPESPVEEEPAPSLTRRHESYSQPHLYSPCLELTFAHGPRSKRGFLMGWHPSCDIVVPNRRGVSAFHCALTFDEGNHLILRDYSRYGTIVSYNGKRGQLRRGFVWILGGNELPQGIKEVGIEIHSLLKFRIVVSTPDNIHSLRYIRNIDRFREGEAGVEDLISSLEVPSGPETRATKKACTAGSEPLLINIGVIGQGGFATVSLSWDVTAGRNYAYKRPRGVGFDLQHWKAEADILGSLDHEHIVRLLDFQLAPSPVLTLEYLSSGTLHTQYQETPFTTQECLAILHQLTSAVAYLHGHEPPIVHRDIKPDNILVQSRNPGNDLHVKLSDFGLSRASDDLATFCGTRQYLAPEIYDRQYKCTAAVDFWSLGVVIFQYAYHLPRGRAQDSQWCQGIVDKLKTEKPDNLTEFLLDAMLVMEPQSRYSAQDCYADAPQHIGPAVMGSALDTTATLPSERVSTVPHQLGPPLDEDPTASVPLDCDSTETRRGIGFNPPPAGPALSTSTPSRKRLRDQSSLSSGERCSKRHAPNSIRKQEDHPSSVAYFREEKSLQSPPCAGSSGGGPGLEAADDGDLEEQVSGESITQCTAVTSSSWHGEGSEHVS